jgi:hypothetical protein
MIERVEGCVLCEYDIEHDRFSHMFPEDFEEMEFEGEFTRVLREEPPDWLGRIGRLLRYCFCFWSED